MKKRKDELKLMFYAFAGGYILAKSGILDDAPLAKRIAEEILLGLGKSGTADIKAGKPDAK